jgi:subtilisin family serine protease
MTRTSRVRLVICVLVSVVLIAGGACATEDDGRMIVMFLDGTPVDVQKLLVTLTGSTVVHVLSLINALAIKIPLGGIEDILTILLSNPAVLGVFDDPIGSVVSSLPLETSAEKEGLDWGLERIGVATLRQQESGATGSGVTVAVLDTGIDLAHPELSQRIAGGFNALPGGGSYSDNHGHGTQMAGIIAAASNEKGIIGAAPQAKLMAVKVLDQSASGHLSDLIKGLQWVYNKGIKLVNMSLGFSEASVPLENAVKRLYKKGIIMVASAGNSQSGDGGGDEGGGDGQEEMTASCDASTQDGGGSDEGGGDGQEEMVAACGTSPTHVMYPAAYPWVIAVAATDVHDQVASYSRYGPEVDVAAPGGARASEMILSTTRGGGYGWGSGTSQAAAHVSGAVALALQRQPQLSFEQVRNLLQATAWDLGYSQEQQGAGLIDVQGMMQKLQ